MDGKAAIWKPRGAVIALGAILLVAACQAGTSSSTQGANSQIVVGQVAEPKSMDPGADTAVNDFRILVNLYDGLVGYGPSSLDIVPALATKWTVSADSKAYTFTLRTGVTFQDGTPFNAASVKYTFDRMLVSGAPGSDTGPFPLAQQFFGSVKDVTAIDDHTVRFTLDNPDAAFLSNLAYPTGFIVSPSAVAKYGKDFGQHPVGTGAFAFESWAPNQSVVVKANPQYWNGAPKVQHVVFRPLPDATSRTAALQSGGADVILEVPADNLAQLKSDSKYVVVNRSGPHLWFLILNAKEGPFKDVRVRQAANYAIDKQSIITDILQGTASVAKGPIPPAFGAASDASLTGYSYDPEKAKQLLAAAGYANGADLTFYTTDSGSGMLEPQSMGEAIQAQLAKVGFRVHIQTFEWNTYLSKVNAGLSGKADMAEMAWQTNDPGTLPYLALRTDAFPDKNGFNSGYYSNPQVDRLLAQIETTPDQTQRDQLFTQLQPIVVADAPWVFVANGSLSVAMSSRLKGVDVHPSYVLYYKDAYIG